MAVTPSDVAIELGRPSPSGDELLRLQSWISQALYLIGRRLGDVALLNPVDVDYVVLQAVAQHARHPGNETQVTVAVDDASTSRTYRSGSGMVAILDEWWTLLDPDLGDSGAFTVTPYSEPDPVFWRGF